MVGTFSGNRQAEQLTRQADRIITNVDHFLHFTTARSRDFTPDFEGGFGFAQLQSSIGQRGGFDMDDGVAING